MQFTLFWVLSRGYLCICVLVCAQFTNNIRGGYPSSLIQKLQELIFYF